jgi:hypothetical protein
MQWQGGRARARRFLRRDFEEELTRSDQIAGLLLEGGRHVLRQEILEIMGEAESAAARADKA